MSQLTVQLLTKNNEATIEKAIQSLQPLNPLILVTDWGSTDSTYEICKQLGARVKKRDSQQGFNELRNELLVDSQTPWNMYMEPWEILVAGYETITDTFQKPPKSYHLQVFKGPLITKEIRIWHTKQNLRFKNPVYEAITDKQSDYLNEPIIFSRDAPPHHGTILKLINKWKRDQPTASDPHYYEACTHLALGHHQNFLNAADYYLFHEKAGMSVVMTKYYSAIVRLYTLAETKEPLRNIAQCIAVKPLMAEFWCVLGDIFYKGTQYEKARVFYENAIILGRKRVKDNNWPVEIAKYKDYPSRMIESCDDILEKQKILVPR